MTLNDIKYEVRDKCDLKCANCGKRTKGQMFGSVNNLECPQCWHSILRTPQHKAIVTLLQFDNL